MRKVFADVVVIIILLFTIFQILWYVVNTINVCISVAEIGLYWRKTFAGQKEQLEYAIIKQRKTFPDVYDLIDTLCLTIHLCSVYAFLWVTWKKRLKIGKTLELLVQSAQKLGINNSHGVCHSQVFQYE